MISHCFSRAWQVCTFNPNSIRTWYLATFSIAKGKKDYEGTRKVLPLPIKPAICRWEWFLLYLQVNLPGTELKPKTSRNDNFSTSVKWSYSPISYFSTGDIWRAGVMQIHSWLLKQQVMANGCQGQDSKTISPLVWSCMGKPNIWTTHPISWLAFLVLKMH